jgi:ubiquinone biosynthesis protein
MLVPAQSMKILMGEPEGLGHGGRRGQIDRRLVFPRLPTGFSRYMNASQLLRFASILAIVVGITAVRLPLLLLAGVRGRTRFYSAAGETLAVCIEALGPVFVKLGQMLSYRVDLLPAALLQPLARLQDRTAPMGPRRTRAAAEAAWGGRLPAAFATFSFKPVACGSIAVVCKAMTHDGEAVAVKVVRPGIARKIERDLACFRRIAASTSYSRYGRDLPIIETFDRMASVISSQADMLAECRNLVALRGMLPADGRVVVPRPIRALTTPDVLVMEFVENEVELMLAPMHDKAFRRATRSLLDLLYRMIFVEGFVHCDMHPGNLLWRANGTLALIDAGMIASLTEQDRVCFRDFFLGLVRNDAEDSSRAILQSALRVPDDLDRAAFKRDVVNLVEAYHGRTARNVLIAEFVLRVFELQRRHRLPGAPGFVSAIWALVMFEGLVRTRYPDLDFQAAAQRFLIADLVASSRRAAAR